VKVERVRYRVVRQNKLITDYQSVIINLKSSKQTNQ